MFFLRNFALITERLQPRHAFPFAAHFVLPDERNWWISETRLGMGPPAETVRRIAPGLRSEVHDLQPGDWVEGDIVHASVFPLIDARSVRAATYSPAMAARRTSSRFAGAFDSLVDAARRARQNAP